jgi:hypothetical protein
MRIAGERSGEHGAKPAQKQLDSILVPKTAYDLAISSCAT